MQSNRHFGLFWFSLDPVQVFSVSIEAEQGRRSVQDKRTKRCFKTIEEKKRKKKRKKYKLSESSSESSHSSTHKTRFEPDQHISKAHCIMFYWHLIVGKDNVTQSDQ